MDQIAIVKRLDADIVKLQIGKRIERVGKFAQIKFRELCVEPS